ncbi:mid region of cactin-domain-containing protein [Macrophomina phaseolina]|uniref:Splicing factor Cactin n=1 Tax=Macrophomina phaseolina TaxID=35725 RepID=A0ABQ8FT62_9PEZI|nr:mid region of cactin-domain-containing protein [Macrophomina phaseolina]
MDPPNQPPWRMRPGAGPNRKPASTIPSKRSADTQEEEWVAGEDRFVLQQAKKKAAIRVKGGRAKPVDWLAVTLRVIDGSQDVLDEDDDADLDIVDPEGVLESLDDKQMEELEKDIETYLVLETDRKNREFWNTMKVICKDRRQKSTSSGPEARGVNTVAADVDRLLGPKSLEELEALEKQIRRKLDSNEPIDVDYWEHLLKSLLVWKAKAKLRRLSQTIVNSRLQGLRKQQEQEALVVQEKLRGILRTGSAAQSSVEYKLALDPEPFLKLRSEDKALESVDEKAFLEKIAEDRRKVLKLGYVPFKQSNVDKAASAVQAKPTDTSSAPGISRFAARDEDFSQATTALYEREVARGVSENEEIFNGEEEVITPNKSRWADKYRPRKPRYFNRVQMGYEWNKYNQTHYDHDNPPPKVVQGYKFNIFYPDLIDKTKAPTYRIERENGRKRGQSFAPAGEEDTCLIRFIAGPPYEDIAFRIVDKEWDYSAKRERGFKSSFDKVTFPQERGVDPDSMTMTSCGAILTRPPGHLAASFPVQKNLLS